MLDHHDTIIINPAKDVDPSYKKQPAENKSPHWYASPEWILIIVGCITALVIGWQSYETRKAATAATRAVKATERSIGHMEEANRISRENMQAGQRAYIAFPMLDFQTLRVADDTGTPIAFQFRLAVENTGNTPALNLIMRVNYWGQDGDQGLPSNYDFRDFAPPDGPAEDYPMYLSAKAKTYSPLLSIPRETIIRLNERQMRLFFYGWATYRDVFEGTPLHRTEFCHELKVLEIAGDRVVFELSAYRKHNSQK